MAQNDLVERILARLILRHPFLSTLALRLERVEDRTTQTAWTDGVRLAVNPGYLEELSHEERLTLLAHECYHVALGHHLRRRGRDLGRWNRACDYAVNALLLADSFTLFPGALLEPAFGNASAEAIYEELEAAERDPGASGSSPGSTSPPGNGSAPASSSSSSDPALPPDSGSAPPSGPPESFGEVRDLPLPAPPSPAQLDDLLAEHAVLVTSLAQQARAQGKDSAGARRAAAAAAEPPTIDWRTLLAEFLTSRSSQDYTWSRPNPRYAPLGVFLPALHATAPGRIAFVLDTSGSVPPAALNAVTGELEAYLGQYPTTVLEVLYADARVVGRATYTAADLPLRLTPWGGGGTDFRPALKDLEESEDPPACVVYLTDLDGAFPEEPPSIPVLWLVFGWPPVLRVLQPPEAPFGRVVTLPY
jgi:predicted metal-dependent peptidase